MWQLCSGWLSCAEWTLCHFFFYDWSLSDCTTWPQWYLGYKSKQTLQHQLFFLRQAAWHASIREVEICSFFGVNSRSLSISCRQANIRTVTQNSKHCQDSTWTSNTKSTAKKDGCKLSLIKSFIVLQKIKSYLTRKKDKMTNNLHHNNPL